jgi:hypothetical protein
MELELEGNLILERPPTRRWVSIVAVVVPVVVCVGLAAWFIRAYIAPPMAAIPSPMQLAAMSRAPLKVEAPAPAPAPETPPPQAASEPEPAAAPPAEARVSLPMFATLSVAPPSFGAPAAYADPVPESAAAFVPPAADQPVAAGDPAIDPAMAITGPVPLPRSKPPVSVAAVAGPVPLPRPRPAEAAPAEAPAVPMYDRTAIQ